MVPPRWTRYAAGAPLVIVAVVAALYAAGWIRQAHRGPRNIPFKLTPGEHLEYAVAAWFGTGTIIVDVSPLLTLDNGTPACRIVYTLKPDEAVSAGYLIKGQLSMILDAATLLPIEYEERLTTGLGFMGGHVKHKKLVYDRTNNTVLYYKSKNGDELQYSRKRSIPPNTHHLASMPYYFRVAAMKPGDVVSVDISDRKRDLTIRADVLREEPYAAPDGSTRAALVLKTVTDFGREDAGNTEFVASLDKEERFLVRLDAKTRWGTISAQLVKRDIARSASADANEDSRNHPGQIPIDTVAR